MKLISTVLSRRTSSKKRSSRPSCETTTEFGKYSLPRIPSLCAWAEAASHCKPSKTPIQNRNFRKISTPTPQSVLRTEGILRRCRVGKLIFLRRRYRRPLPLKKFGPTPHREAGPKIFWSTRKAEPKDYLPSLALRSWCFLTISSCTLRGTCEYFMNSMVNSPLPWVAERRSVE